jgi:hypothetical protein
VPGLEANTLCAHLFSDDTSFLQNQQTNSPLFFFSLLVECFTKYCMVNESIRHFRALHRIPGGTKVLYDEGNCGDPLSLYLRSLCLDGEFLLLCTTMKKSGEATVSIKLFVYEL